MKKFGLIGRPLGHSASASYFADKFATQSIDAQYALYELDSIEQVEGLRGELCGFNVTIPYKKQILPYLATISEEAAKVGAVNCVKIDDNGAMHGYNTDVVGIRATLAGLDFLYYICKKHRNKNEHSSQAVPCSRKHHASSVRRQS